MRAGIALAVVGVLLLGAAPMLVHADPTPVSIDTTALAVGEVGVPYTQILAASGGTTPHSWDVSAGTLPSGLTMVAATGVISGTPTAAGTATFTVRLTDGGSPTPQTTTKVLSLTVNPAVAVTTASLPAGVIGMSYEQTLAASGGVLPFTWNVTAGALPSGLMLNGATGMISGTPTAIGTSVFAVEVHDALNHTAAAVLSIQVAASASVDLKVTTSNLPHGMVGTAYAQSLEARGGTPPYTWAIATGGLPAGLSLNRTSGAITGTPTFAGKVQFGIQVTDSAGHTATRSLSIDVRPAGTIETDDFAARVTAVCAADIATHPPLTALCRIWADEQMPQWARKTIGHVILKLADRLQDDEHHKDGRGNDDRDDDDRGRRDHKHAAHREDASARAAGHISVSVGHNGSGKGTGGQRGHD